MTHAYCTNCGDIGRYFGDRGKRLADQTCRRCKLPKLVRQGSKKHLAHAAAMRATLKADTATDCDDWSGIR